MPEYSQYAQTMFFADEFVAFLDFQKLICRECRLRKSDGWCSMGDDVSPAHHACLYNDLYEEVNSTALKLENLLDNLRWHSAEQELTSLKADEERSENLRQIRKAAGF